MKNLNDWRIEAFFNGTSHVFKIYRLTKFIATFENWHDAKEYVEIQSMLCNIKKVG